MSRYIHRYNFIIGDAEKDHFNAAVFAVDGEEAGPETVTLPLPDAESPTHWGASGVYTEAQRIVYEPILDNYQTLSWWRLTASTGELQATNVEASEAQIGQAFTWEEALIDAGLD